MLAQFLSYQPGFMVCGEAADAEEALDQLATVNADVVTVDLGLGAGMTGLDLVRQVKQRWPDLMCIVLSAHPELEVGQQVLQAGAAAYVEKGNEEELIAVLHERFQVPKAS
ncbi:MAG: hypothetical protein RhofKO_41190 [Rhodothermales bacterium]